MNIYLACPYSHIKYAVCEYRFKTINKIAGHLMQNGHCVFSPISHSHPISKEIKNISHLDHNFWLSQDLPILVEWADKLIIACMPQWEKSFGIHIEKINAVEFNIPIEYLSWKEIKTIIKE